LLVVVVVFLALGRSVCVSCSIGTTSQQVHMFPVPPTGQSGGQPASTGRQGNDLLSITQL